MFEKGEERWFRKATFGGDMVAMQRWDQDTTRGRHLFAVDGHERRAAPGAPQVLRMAATETVGPTTKSDEHCQVADGGVTG